MKRYNIYIWGIVLVVVGYIYVSNKSVDRHYYVDSISGIVYEKKIENGKYIIFMKTLDEYRETT